MKTDPTVLAEAIAAGEKLESMYKLGHAAATKQLAKTELDIRAEVVADVEKAWHDICETYPLTVPVRGSKMTHKEVWEAREQMFLYALTVIRIMPNSARVQS